MRFIRSLVGYMRAYLGYAAPVKAPVVCKVLTHNAWIRPNGKVKYE